MSKMLTALGMMSGTSLDGIDAAIIRTDGEKVELTDYFMTVPYADNFREKLRNLLNTKRNHEQVEKEFTAAHFEVVRQLLDKFNLKSDDIDVIGFHGQTIDHRPDEGFTWQIGDGKLLAKLTGIDVVNDFRTADVKAGGQGAPLVPLYHAALFQDFEKPLAVLNIGGVANVTYIGKSLESGVQSSEKPPSNFPPLTGGSKVGGTLITHHSPLILAFDTGPGNAMIDDLMFKNTGKHFDEDGKIASSGKVNEKILEKLLADPFYAKKAPKSLDRNHFKYLVEKTISKLSFEDGAATLVAFTTEAIAQGMKHFPEAPVKWYVTGGGRHNEKIMEELEKRIRFQVSGSGFQEGNIPPSALLPLAGGEGGGKLATGHSPLVTKIEEAGFDGDALEAQAFAFLAVRSLRKLPLSLPTTTGVSSPSVSGGVFCPA